MYSSVVLSIFTLLCNQFPERFPSCKGKTWSVPIKQLLPSSPSLASSNHRLLSVSTNFYSSLFHRWGNWGTKNWRNLCLSALWLVDAEVGKSWLSRVPGLHPGLVDWEVFSEWVPWPPESESPKGEGRLLKCRFSGWSPCGLMQKACGLAGILWWF